MPTGYTEGILNGEIKDFSEFAKLCMRAFGATLHLRDEPLNKAYEPMQPSNYYKEQLIQARNTLKRLRMKTDEQIIAFQKTKLMKDKKMWKRFIEKSITHKKLLNSFLEKIVSWELPSVNHKKFKDFMIEQINITIDGDCNLEYPYRELEKITYELQHLNAPEIREKLLTKAEKDVLYFAEKNEKEIQRCNDANAWVMDVLKTLEK